MSPGRSAVEALYREVVLDHYRHPRNREPLASADGEALVHNPVCGDQVRVEVALDGACVDEVSARTRGCSIAVAAGSVMTELVRGLDTGRVAELADAIRSLVSGDPPPESLDERLRAFARVADLPSRRRCALLAWDALDEALTAARRADGVARSEA